MECINAFFEEVKHFYSLLAWRWIRAPQLFIDVSVHSVKLHLCPRGRRLPFSLVIGHVASPLAIHAALLLSSITWPLIFDCFDSLVDALARCLKHNEFSAWLDEHAVRVRVSSRDGYQSFHRALDFYQHMFGGLKFCAEDPTISNPEATEARRERRRALPRRSRPVIATLAVPAAMSCENRSTDGNRCEHVRTA